jgi:superfamily I DNA/RNA helicase
MGFASYYEDVQERYWASEPLTGPCLQGVATSPSPADPLERPRRVIKDFWAYYQRERAEDDVPRGRWEEHFATVRTLHDALSVAASLHETDPDAWDVVCETERHLREFFRARTDYGSLSRALIDRVARASRVIRDRCRAVERELNDFTKTVKGMSREERLASDVLESIQHLREIGERLTEDINGRRAYDVLAREVVERWQHFLHLRAVVAVQRRYRPTLQHLDRLHLNEQQERFVALDYQGAYRIQGASGSGKTIILIHRALRLAAENPDKTVRVFTINRSLAELLRSSIDAIHGGIPSNLHVAASYDILLDCLSLFESRHRYRLVDDRSGERINLSWCDFFHHRGKEESQNIFASQGARDLIDSIEERAAPKIDASRYLRDEMIYVQSAFRRSERYGYIATPRAERSIPLQKFQRATCLRVLDAWEEWLGCGDLCDIDGLTLQAVDYFEDAACLPRIRRAFPTDFVLLDEVQDFSTLELRALRLLVDAPDGANRFFFVGDLNQKVYAKHHDSIRAGFNFRGKAAILSQNYRNTQQILRAAYCLPATFPPQAEENLDVANPEFSIYEGGKPVVLECLSASHVARILDLVQRRRGSRVAVVSENDALLAEVRRQATGRGHRCHELFRNEDLDQWKQQQDSPLSAAIVVARMEAVKGFEFDTVIACDLSEGAVPRPGTPRDEYWREAAVVYSALTRARDELIITYVGQPSVFLHAMEPEIAMQAELDEAQFLARVGAV